MTEAFPSTRSWRESIQASHAVSVAGMQLRFRAEGGQLRLRLFLRLRNTHLAWRSANQPLTPEPNPRLVFERLFGVGSARRAHQQSQTPPQQEQHSILDFVMDDADAIQKK